MGDSVAGDQFSREASSRDVSNFFESPVVMMVTTGITFINSLFLSRLLRVDPPSPQKKREKKKEKKRRKEQIGDEGWWGDGGGGGGG